MVQKSGKGSKSKPSITRSRQMATDQADVMENNENAQIADVEFNEDGHRVKLHVDTGGDESYCMSESSDGEIIDPDDAVQLDQRNLDLAENWESDLEEGEPEFVPKKKSLCKPQIGSGKKLSTREKIQKIDNEMETKIIELHQLMTKQGMNKLASKLQDCLEACQTRTTPKMPPGKVIRRGRSIYDFLPVNYNDNANRRIIDDSRSEETIYRQAIMKKRGSSSSEDEIVMTDDGLVNNIDNLLISERQQIGFQEQPDSSEEEELDYEDDIDATPPEPMPSTYRDATCYRQKGRTFQTNEEQTNQLITDTEKAKANIFPQTGKHPIAKGCDGGFQFTAQMDEEYMVIGGHIDENTQSKIIGRNALILES